jgi:MerR family transcriptional regulator, thiopeptide resistance regulator
MAYTVGEVSKLTRVSVRALHHYDEIGLVKPSGRSAAGYRQYEDRDLERLQQVLFYRELGLKLDEIAAILNDPAFDRRKALIAQREQLEKDLEHKRAVLALVEKSIRALTGENGGYAMTKEEMFEVFGDFDVETHEEEARQRWGNTDAFKESTKRAKKYGKEDWQRIKAEGEEILDAFAAAMDGGTPAADAAEVAERHRQHISRWFYECSKKMHSGLGQMYVDDPRFAATYESKRAGLAAYVRDAILANELRG